MYSATGIITIVFLHLCSARNDNLSKNYQFPNQTLVLADPSFDNTTLFYALYERSAKQCTVVQEINPFTNSTVTRKCQITLQADRVQLVVGFGTEKVILITQETMPTVLKLKTTTVHMASCKTVDAELIDVPSNWTNRKMYREQMDVVVSEKGFEVIIKGLSHMCTKPNAKIYCGLAFDADGNRIEGPLIWPKMAYDKIDIVSPVLPDASGQGYFFVNRDSSLLAFQLDRKGGPKYVKLWYTTMLHSNLWREGYSIANKVDGMCYNVNSTIGCWQTDQEGELRINTEFEFEHKIKDNMRQCNKTQDTSTKTTIPDSTTQVMTTQETTAQETTTQDTTIQDTTTQDTTIQDTTTQESRTQDTTVQDTTVQEIITEDTTIQNSTALEDNVVQNHTIEGNITENAIIEDNVIPINASESNTVNNNETLDITLYDNVTENNTVLESAIIDNTTLENAMQDNTTQDSAIQENITEYYTVQDASEQVITVQGLATQKPTTEDNALQKNETEENAKQDTTAQDITVQDVTEQDITVQNTTVQDVTVQDITVQGIATQKTVTLESLSQLGPLADKHEIWNLFIHNLRNGGFVVLIITCPNRVCSGSQDHYYLLKINAQGKLIGQLEIDIKSKCNAENGEVLAKVFENDQGQYCSVRLCKNKVHQEGQLETLVNCYCNADFK